MKIRIAVLAIAVSSLLISTSTQGRSTIWLIYGTVRWSTGTAAASVKIRLLQDAREKAVVYTNQQGRYGISGATGQPSNYTLQLWLGNRLLRTFGPQELRQIPRGGRLDIRLRR